ncbi:hypothetical protein [uncultured Vagococcus sp.]|uniref:hypothetical protein n=1 Tax=uncultured Vagococcus sp. TaxID=189676 RepID=UPI0028D55561|nr:hypothetical protein [uncultured Vagococcus sp.]
MFNDIDFFPGVILYDSNLSLDNNVENQVDLLKEDLFQVEYKGRYIIDVGWYPEFDKDGSFKILVVKNYDWTTYLYEKTCSDGYTLNKYMRECIALIQAV